EAALDEGREVAEGGGPALNQGEGADGDGGREGGGGQLADPVALRGALGEEGFAGRLVGAIDADGAEAHGCSTMCRRMPMILPGWSIRYSVRSSVTASP